MSQPCSSLTKGVGIAAAIDQPFIICRSMLGRSCLSAHITSPPKIKSRLQLTTVSLFHLGSNRLLKGEHQVAVSN